MSVLIKPLITEKMSSKTEKFNSYGFLVNIKANKLSIKEEVEKSYGVVVERVNTMSYCGKSKTRYTKGGVLRGFTSSYKKAIISLALGESIDFYNNI